MIPRDWAVLAFKVLGLWFAANGAIGLANLPAMWGAAPAESVQNVATLVMGFPSLLSIVVGALVWISTPSLAARVFGPDPADVAAHVFGDGTPDAPPRPAVEEQPLFALALAVIGILLTVEATPIIVYGATMFVYSRRTATSIFGSDSSDQALIWDAAAKANFAAACTRFLIGLALLLGPARLSAAYSRIRGELRGTLAEDAAREANSAPNGSGQQGADGDGKTA